MIKTSTKIFAIAPLLLFVIGKILPDAYAGQSFLWLAYLAEIVFIFCLIVENKKAHWLYSIVLLLILLGNIGGLFRIMHWHLGAPLFLLGLLGTAGMACLFLNNSVRSLSKNKRYEQLVLSLCLFLQLILAIYTVAFHGSVWLNYASYLHYPIAILCAILLMQKKYVHTGEKNLILYLFMHSLFVIIRQLL